MPIEKAFRIDAPPQRIYDALTRDVNDAAGEGSSAFEVLRRAPPHELDLRVTIAGVPCWLTYRLTPRDGYTEVAGMMQPFGWRYTFFRIMTFGMRDQGFEIALVEGLANLKASVEEQDFPDESERTISPPDE